MMPMVLAQVAESAESYDAATIALLTLFIVALVTTAGLVLRDILKQERAEPFPGSTFAGEAASSDQTLSPISSQPAAAPTRNPQAHTRSAEPSPMWLRQAVSGYSVATAEGIRATIATLVDAANRGDLRMGFSLYTPEFLVRQQQAMGLDAGEFERMLRTGPAPPASPIEMTAIGDLILDPPNRATAVVHFRSSDEPEGYHEQIRFLRDPNRTVWLIESIERAPN